MGSMQRKPLLDAIEGESAYAELFAQSLKCPSSLIEKLNAVGR
jgi:hypothetical protein